MFLWREARKISKPNSQSSCELKWKIEWQRGTTHLQQQKCRHLGMKRSFGWHRMSGRRACHMQEIYKTRITQRQSDMTKYYGQQWSVYKTGTQNFRKVVMAMMTSHYHLFYTYLSHINPLKLLYVPPVLTYWNPTFCPRSVICAFHTAVTVNSVSFPKQH
jgi:hypothetical protein